MSDINSISITGRLGQDPELTNVGSEGTAKTTLRLASSRVFNKGGEKTEQTTWVDVVCWGKQAEVVKEYCVKGQEVAVTGRLEIEDWEDKEGGKRRSTRIIAENVKFGAKPGGGGSDSGSKAAVVKALDSMRELLVRGVDPAAAMAAVTEKLGG